MKKSDLKPFYVVKCNGGYYYLVCQGDKEICLIRKDGWLKFDELNEELECFDNFFTITEVYGYRSTGPFCNEISSKKRKLLWKRKDSNETVEDAKEVTIEQIENELGYKIKIVG